jgi:putative NADH-flavin reductase
MSRVVLLGATGSLGRHVLRQALAAGYEVTVLVRTPAKLVPEDRSRISLHTGDLSAPVPLDLVRGRDALINGAGHVAEADTFVALVDRLVTSVDSLTVEEQPVCWFLAGAAILDLDASGRRAVELPLVKATYWPHQANLDRLSRSGLDWRLLRPGPMVDEPALGLQKLRISLDVLPVEVPATARALSGPQLLPVFATRIPEMTVPYADAAAVMLGNLDRGSAMSRHRVGLALPVGMIGHNPGVAG